MPRTKTTPRLKSLNVAPATHAKLARACRAIDRARKPIGRSCSFAEAVDRAADLLLTHIGQGPTPNRED